MCVRGKSSGRVYYIVHTLGLSCMHNYSSIPNKVQEIDKMYNYNDEMYNAIHEMLCTIAGYEVKHNPAQLRAVGELVETFVLEEE